MIHSAASPIAATAILAAWLGLASIACAAEPPAPPTGSAAQAVTVQAGDLNLNTEAGAKALIYRISDAATRACWPDQLDRIAEYQHCRDGLVLQGVKAVNKPQVGLAYAEHYKPAAKPVQVASR
jgi:UrcA family protein